MAVAFALCHLHPVGGSLNINIGDGWRDTDIGGASLSSSHRMEVIVDSCWGVAQAVHLNKQYLRPPALLINVATERLMCAHVEPFEIARNQDVKIVLSPSSTSTTTTTTTAGTRHSPRHPESAGSGRDWPVSAGSTFVVNRGRLELHGAVFESEPWLGWVENQGFLALGTINDSNLGTGADGSYGGIAGQPRPPFGFVENLTAGVERKDSRILRRRLVRARSMHEEEEADSTEEPTEPHGKVKSTPSPVPDPATPSPVEETPSPVETTPTPTSPPPMPVADTPEYPDTPSPTPSPVEPEASVTATPSPVEEDTDAASSTPSPEEIPVPTTPAPITPSPTTPAPTPALEDSPDTVVDTTLEPSVAAAAPTEEGEGAVSPAPVAVVETPSPTENLSESEAGVIATAPPPEPVVVSSPAPTTTEDELEKEMEKTEDDYYGVEDDDDETWYEAEGEREGLMNDDWEEKEGYAGSSSAGLAAEGWTSNAAGIDESDERDPAVDDNSFVMKVAAGMFAAVALLTLTSLVMHRRRHTGVRGEFRNVPHRSLGGADNL